VNKTQKAIFKTSEPTNKPLNAFYETFSNSLITKPSESIDPKVTIAPKVNIVTTTSLNNGPPRGTSSILTYSNHGIKALSATIPRPECSTIYLSSTKYQVLRAAARPHQNSNNNIILKSQQKTVDVASKVCIFL
jgi:hypothetical protein